jgi:hypothetical protein
LSLSDKNCIKDNFLLTLHIETILHSDKVVWILVLKIVQVLAKESWGLIQNAWHLLGRCIDQDHLGDVHDVSLVWLFGQVPLVDIESLQVDGRYKLAMGLAKFLDKCKDLFSVFLVFKLLQVVVKLVQYLSKKGTLSDSCLSEKEVDFFSKSRIVFIEVEEDYLDFVVVESENFIESLNSMESCDSDFINLVVQHVD